MPAIQTPDLRQTLDADTYADQAPILSDLIATAALSAADRAAISAAGADLVRRIRASSAPGLM